MCVEKGRSGLGMWPIVLRYTHFTGKFVSQQRRGKEFLITFVCFLYYLAIVHLGSSTSLLCLIFLVFKKG